MLFVTIFVHVVFLVHVHDLLERFHVDDFIAGLSIRQERRRKVARRANERRGMHDARWQGASAWAWARKEEAQGEDTAVSTHPATATHFRHEAQKRSGSHDPPLAPRRLTRRPLRPRPPPRPVPSGLHLALATLRLAAGICHRRRVAAGYVGGRWCSRWWRGLTASWSCPAW